MRHVLVDGLGHAWSGGAEGFAFSDPSGPSASEMVWRFFRARTRSDYPLIESEPPRCTERVASSFMHYWWYRSMTFAEYRCDMWGAGARRRLDGVWSGGRCR